MQKNNYVAKKKGWSDIQIFFNEKALRFDGGVIEKLVRQVMTFP